MNPLNPLLPSSSKRKISWDDTDAVAKKRRITSPEVVPMSVDSLHSSSATHMSSRSLTSMDTGSSSRKGMPSDLEALQELYERMDELEEQTRMVKDAIKEREASLTRSESMTVYNAKELDGVQRLAKTTGWKGAVSFRGGDSEVADKWRSFFINEPEKFIVLL